MSELVYDAFARAFHFLPRFGTALLILAAFWGLSQVAKSAISRFGKSRDLHQDLTHILARTASLTLWLFGIVTALGTIGVDVSALVAGLGLTGFALGFALKDIISNTTAGVLVLIYRPIDREDHITVGAFDGQVREINLRYTVLTGEDKTMYVPNASLFSSGIVVHNKG